LEGGRKRAERGKHRGQFLGRGSTGQTPQGDHIFRRKKGMSNLRGTQEGQGGGIDVPSGGKRQRRDKVLGGGGPGTRSSMVQYRMDDWPLNKVRSKNMGTSREKKRLSRF